MSFIFIARPIPSARTLGMLLIPLANDYSVPLRRAPAEFVCLLSMYANAQNDPIHEHDNYTL